MKRLVLGIAIALGGCASVPMTGAPAELFNDALFPAPPVPVEAHDPFAFSEAMRDYLSDPLARRVLELGPRLGLVKAMSEDVRLEYDGAITRTAAEAFAARAGNCLSLVLLAATFSKQLGIPLHYQSVHGFDTWTRSQGIAFRSGHVNVVLGARADDTIPGRTPASPLIVDFLPSADVARQPSRVIPEDTIIAMYRNNRAAETLTDGDLAAAYWWARSAIESAPQFVPAYNTLGVVYLRHGSLADAELTLRYALAREPENAEILTNLSAVLSRQGRAEEAEAVRLRLAEIAPYPPYQFLDQGLAALARGETLEAARLIRRELDRMPYDHEVHSALALVSLRLGDVPRARKHMSRAINHSPTRERQRFYAAKLEHIESLTVSR